jgi:hypothetical protein
MNSVQFNELIDKIILVQQEIWKRGLPTEKYIQEYLDARLKILADAGITLEEFILMAETQMSELSKLIDKN